MDVQVSKTAGPEDLSAPVRDEVKKEIVTWMHRKLCTQN